MISGVRLLREGCARFDESIWRTCHSRYAIQGHRHQDQGIGSIRGVRVTLQAQSHIEGDIIHQSLAIEQGAYFEVKSRRTDNPLEEVKASSAGSPRPVHKPSDFDSKPNCGWTCRVLPPPASHLR